MTEQHYDTSGDTHAELRALAEQWRTGSVFTGATVLDLLADLARKDETIRELRDEHATCDREFERVEAALVEAQREARSEWETQAATIRLIDEKWHAAEARAEQAERQVRAGLALLARIDADKRIRHDHAYPMEVGPHHCDGCDLQADVRAALSGVSGPTHHERCSGQHEVIAGEAACVLRPTTEGASE